MQLYAPMKERITITVERELLKWLDEKVAEHLFANRSHGVEFLIARKKKEESDEKKNNSA